MEKSRSLESIQLYIRQVGFLMVNLPLCFPVYDIKYRLYII